MACDVIFTQISINAGIRNHRESAVVAMITEFTQLDKGAVSGKPVVIPTDTNTLTDIEKRKALPAVKLIKKYDGVLKGRYCVNGSRQRKYFKQDESVASPTAALESLLVALLIDAYDGIYIETYDVPGAYLQSRLAPRDDNDQVLMKLRGNFVDIIYKVNTEHNKNVIYEKEQKVLFISIRHMSITKT